MVTFRTNPHIALSTSSGRSSSKKILNRIDRFRELMATPAKFGGSCRN